MDGTTPHRRRAEGMLGRMAAEQQRDQRLMAEGLVGQATITGVRETATLPRS